MKRGGPGAHTRRRSSNSLPPPRTLDKQWTQTCITTHRRCWRCHSTPRRRWLGHARPAPRPASPRAAASAPGHRSVGNLPSHEDPAPRPTPCPNHCGESTPSTSSPWDDGGSGGGQKGNKQSGGRKHRHTKQPATCTNPAFPVVGTRLHPTVPSWNLRNVPTHLARIARRAHRQHATAAWWWLPKDAHDNDKMKIVPTRTRQNAL